MSGPAWPPTPGAAPRGRGGAGGMVLPLALVAVGVVLLLNNIGVVPWDAWRSVWRLWPLALVLVGLELVLGGRLPRAVVAGLMLGVLGVGIAAWSANLSRPTPPPVLAATEETSQVLGDIREGQVTVRFGAGRLVVDDLDPSSGMLASMRYSGPPDLRPRPSYRARSGVGDLEYTARGSSAMVFPFFPPMAPFGGPPVVAPPGAPEMRLLLTRAVPLAVTLQTGAAESEVDLSDLRLSRVDLSAGATSTRLLLGRPQGTLPVRVQGGASTLDVTIPEGVPAQVQVHGGLSTVNVDERRFPSVEGRKRFASPDYASAADRVDLLVEVGAATVTVR